jgi:hypothetical protein
MVHGDTVIRLEESTNIEVPRAIEYRDYGVPPGDIRYQLLHRAVSAIITGEQYRAVAAVLLIHSFSEEQVGWSDYVAFADLFGIKAVHGSIQRLRSTANIPLYGAWITGDCSFLKS